jgi:acetolactate synthase-1/2/3 large subunit
MKGAEILLQCLKEQGVRDIFGYPGGAVLPFYDHLNKQPEIRHILVRHEQGAALAADGYARASGKTGVCLATSGPGATNLVTGIANAHLDSVPMVAISGQVATTVIGTDAFQEVDMVGICMPITKQTFQIHDARDIPRIVAEAFYLAESGRQGPVLIDLPKNVQNQEVKNLQCVPRDKIDLRGYKPVMDGNPVQIKRAKKLIASAKKPVILCGHGVLSGNAVLEFLQFINQVQAPVMSTLLAMDVIPMDHPLNLGMMGMHGTVAANFAVYNSDLVIGVGLRFDDRILGDPDDFAPNAKVIHIEIDRAEIGKNRHADIPVVGDVKHILPELTKDIQPRDHSKWIAKVREWDEAKNAHLKKRDKPGRRSWSGEAMELISELTDGEAIVAADVGQNQMWTAMSYKFKNPRNHLSSGGLGAMGAGMPMAMGAKVARPDDLTIAIVGDGGFQMNFQELMTMVQDKIDVKTIILNNGYLGMVRQWQELFYDKNYSYTPLLSPDFVKLSESFGVKAWRADNLKEARKVLKEALFSEGPAVVELLIEEEENVFPMVAPGASLKDTRVE